MLKPLKTVFGLLRQLIRFPPEYCTKRLFCFYGDRLTLVTLQALHGVASQETPSQVHWPPGNFKVELQVETRLFNEFGMHEAASIGSCLSVSHVESGSSKN